MTKPWKIALAVVGVAVVLFGAGVVWFAWEVATFGATMAEMPEIPVSREGRLEEASAALAVAKDKDERWLALGPAALENGISGDSKLAESLALEALALAPAYRKNWNYGNAIHEAHLALGHVALRRGDRARAVSELLEAGKTPGSPQLNSFGPQMNLARDLLKEGEQEAVLQYIDHVAVFWKLDRGSTAKWREMIREGRTPNFFLNLR